MSIPENEPKFAIYQHDEYGYYTGESLLITKYDGIPYRWVKFPVPEDALEEGKFWKLNGDSWVQDDPRVEPVKVPTSVTPRQARLALALTPSSDENFPHALAYIEYAFTQLEEPSKTLAKISWEYAVTIERSDPLIGQIKTVIGLTDEDLDDLFIQASTL